MRNKWIVNIVRVLPILLSIYVVFVGITILKNIYSPQVNSLLIGFISEGGFFSQILILLLSRAFKFCLAHQLIIYNLLFIFTLRYLEENKILIIDYSIYFWIIPTTILLIIYAINRITNGRKLKKKIG